MFKQVKPLILIVDDVPRNLQVVGKILDQNNYEVAVADNAKAALDILQNINPDLILLDIMMPDMDGYELCGLIKKQDNLRNIPVIFLTAQTDVDDIVKGFEAGGVDYITKPFNFREFLIRIKNHLDLKNAREQIEKNSKIIHEFNELLIRSNQDKDKYLDMINNELESAAEYVSSLLPSPINTGKIKTDWIFIPSQRLGGDSFGYRQIDKDNFMVYLLDVCGHGIRSALHSVTILNVLNYGTLAKTDFKNPEEVLYSLNNMFQMSEHNNLFFSIWYGVFNKKERKLNYAGAGHPPALLFNKEGEVTNLYSRNKMMGVIPNYDMRSTEIEINEKSEMYIYSDGAYEILKPDGKHWSVEGFTNIVRDSVKNGENIRYVYDECRRINGDENLSDDFSLLKVELT
jgi:phosphoserine phosphatase RsbU/P